ncbi:autotransporter outer membrane beta-barrel domain-containing protein [Thalassotalea sp. G20_0]|uniref:autotransporter outer membrane beta-barrel domain-containing protein n=1 Tax=Thalassotalea sp. G20_0 TaxID=2821093 RepID=UPI001ADD5B8B|nr:autotransporter outer membrane beta-barrel domain-containing protein [Thalassotalea sp. G20_0]MBO9495995.1 autotransporter outer membrane beta-barrel domain-containing protein [Thalassotalea sp. G20_0]
MSRSVVILRKKALVLGISSVLAGWSGSGGLYAEELDVAPSVDVKPAAPAVMSQSNGGGGDSSDSTKPAYWPPEKQAIIIGQNPVKAINGIDIKEPGENISLEGGNLEIPTGVTIKVTGTGDGASIVGQSGTNTLTLTNTGQASVEVGAGATGVKVVDQSLTISGAGSITAATSAADATGVSVAGGTLTINGSTIEGSKAAIAITGSATVDFQKGSVITGLGGKPAVDAPDIEASDKPVIVNIQDGTFTGDIKGGGSDDDKITITATTGDGIKGNISGFETINITGTGWKAQGHVSGANKLKTNSAIEDLRVSKKAEDLAKSADPNTLKIKMASDETLTIETAGGADGKVKNLHILDATHLNLSDGNSSSPGPATVDKITVGDTAGWQVDGVAKDVSVVKTTGTIENLYVNVQNLLGSDRGSLSVNSKGAENLTIATNTNNSGDVLGKIGILHIHGDNTKLTLSDDVKDHKPGFASIDNIFVDGITGWHVDGFASQVEALNTLGTVNNLYVYDQNYALSTIKNSEAGTLRVRSDKLEVNTVKGLSAVGKIDHLHILGATELNLNKGSSDPAEVGKITVGDPAGWQVNGLAKGVSALTTDGTVNHLYVSDSNAVVINAIKDKDNAAGSLQVMSDELAITSTKTGDAAGKIDQLHILGVTKLTGAAPVIKNIEVSANGWQLLSALSDVQSITASRSEADKGDEPTTVINAISLVGQGAAAPVDGVTGSLNINAPISTPKNRTTPIQITGTETELIKSLTIGEGVQFGTVTNVDDIIITGDNWQSSGLVINTESITVGAEGSEPPKGTVSAIKSVPYSTNVISSPPKATLNVTFNQQADLDDFLEIQTTGNGVISGIDFREASLRPSIKFVPIANTDYTKVFGNSSKTDTLVISTGVSAPTGDKWPNGFKGIEYAAPPASIIPDLKRLGLAKIETGTEIKAVDKANRSGQEDSKKVLSIPFTKEGAPDSFYLKTTADADDNAYSINFNYPNRPNTTFEIAGGKVTKLENGDTHTDKLIISGGAIEGNISTINSMSINGGSSSTPTWETSGTFTNLESIKVNDGGVLTALNVEPVQSGNAASSISKQTLKVQTTSKQNLAVNVVKGGTLTTMDIAKDASLGAISGAETVNINGIATLGPITNAASVKAGELDFDQVQVGSGLPAPNDRASIPNLVLNTPDRAVALTTKSIGTLDLANGAKLGAMTGDVNALNITGKEWEVSPVITLAAKSSVVTVNVAQGANVSGIVTQAPSSESKVNQSGSKAPSPVKIAIKPIEGESKNQTLKVKTSGNIDGNLDFTIVPDHTTVELTEDGGSINGDITGAKNITFGGKSTLNGTINGPVNTVQVTGQLTALSKNTAETFTIRGPVSKSEAPEPPTLSIAKGGKLIINRSVKVESGSFHQDGEINIDPSAPLPAKDKPLVTAKSINIGPDARVVFDSSKASAGQVLMAATDKGINQPVTVAATNEQYHHFYSILNPKDPKKMELATKNMQAYVCDLAASGGAPASAVKAVDVAVAPKKAPDAAAAQSRATVKDPLNAFVVQRATTPDSSAKLAKQLTPNDTGSNITAARDAQQMSSKAIDTRNTNRRTGMNSGDMMESGGVWIQYAYNDAKQDEKDGVFGYKDKTNGFTLGADWELDDMFDAGVAYTYAKSDISGEGAGSGSTMDSKNHIFTLYGSYDQDDMFMDGMISYASGDNKGHRNVSGNRVQSSYDSKSWGIGLSGGMTLPSNEEWSWQPLVAFNYYRITTDDYRESAPLNYLAFDQVKNDDYTIMELGVGVRLMGDIQSDDLAFRPAFKLMVLHDFKDDPVTMTAHYAAGGNSFVVHGAKRDTTRYQFAASVDMDLHDNMTLSFNYSHDWMDNFKSDGFIARLRYDF